MAQNPSNVIPDQLIVVEGDAGFVPKSEPSDAGKVLKVDSQGTPVWGEDSGGTVFEPDKGLQLVDGKLSVKAGGYGITNNMNGEGIVGIVAANNTLTLSSGGVRVTNPLPASAQADAGKVLKVDAQGAPVWGDAPADIFVAKYGVTTYSEIAAAIADGKDVVCLYVDSNNVAYTYTMTQHDAENQSVRFTWLKKNNNRTINNPYDWWYEILMQGTTWYNVAGPYPANLEYQVDASTMNWTQSQNRVQFSVKNPLPASTSAEANKVLTVNSSGTPEWADAQGGGGGGSSAVSGSYVVDADPVYVSVAPSTPTVIGSGHVYYELADSTETRQIAAIEIPEIILTFDSDWPQTVAIQNNLSTSWAQITLSKVNTSTNTYTYIASLSERRYVQRTTSSSLPYFWIDASHLLYIPSNPLPVLSENEKYVIMVSSYVGDPSSYIYPSSIGSWCTANVYFSSTSDKVVFSPSILPDVNAPLSTREGVLSLGLDTSKGIFVQTDDNLYYNTLSIRNEDVDKSLGYDPQNPQGYVRYVSLKNVENSTSEWSDKKVRFPAHRAYLESSETMKANPSSPNVGWSWQLNQGSRGNVFIVHFEIPMTSSGNADVNCICKFYLQDREEDWETMQQTMHYHYYTLIGQYIASEQMAVFDGAITVPETKGMPDNNYWSPTVTPLDSGTTLTVDYNRSPKYCWSFI